MNRIPSHSTRMESVQTPIIPVVAELIRETSGTISLGQGVVSYEPPPTAIAQIAKFLGNPHNHRYQSIQGIPPLLEAIASKLKTDNGIELDDSRQVIVTAGSNMGFLNAVLAITQPRDEVILQVPYYFNHEMAITIAGCQPVLVPTDENYQLRPDLIQAAITERTRAIVTISPNNPTGVVYPESDLREVNEICQRHGLYHIHDEAYEYFTYNGIQPFSPGSISEGKNTISLYSLSKAYGFASWRIGYMVIPTHLQSPVLKIQDTNVICPPVVSQYAAIGALQAGRNYCQEKLTAIAEVRQLMLHQLQAVSDICTVPPANGAFYFLLKVHTTLSSMDVVEQLIRKHRVAVLPGDVFGTKDGCYLRVAYGALERETAIEGIERLVNGLQAVTGY